MLPLLDILSPIIDRALSFIPDPAKKAEAQLALQKELDTNEQAIMSALSAINQKQADINLEEAKSDKLIDKWRDFIGWTCGAAFAWQYVLQPMAVFTLTAFHKPINLPAIDFSSMSTVLMGMLGLAGMHMYQSTK